MALSTASTGQRLSASWLNTLIGQIQIGFNKLHGFAIGLIQQSGQSLTSGSPTAITYGSGSEEYQYNNGTSWHSTSSNTSRVTPDVAGLYRCVATTAMAVGATNYTQLSTVVAKNGTRVDSSPVTRPDPGTAGNGSMAEADVYLNGTTDYVEHWAQQTSGGANSTNASSPFRCTFRVSLIRPDDVV